MNQPYAYATPESRENSVNGSVLEQDLLNRTAELEKGLHGMKDKVAGLHVKLVCILKSRLSTHHMCEILEVLYQGVKYCTPSAT